MNAWDDIAKALSQQKDANDALLFGDEGISGKQCNDRFKIVIDFCDRVQKNTDFRSGQDDEDEATEIHQLGEQLLEMYNGHITEETDKNEEKKNKTKRDREQARIIRDASIGMIDAEGIVVHGEGQSKKSKIAHENANEVSSELDLGGLIIIAKEEFADTPQKSENEKKRLELSARKVDIEEKKITFQERELSIRETERVDDREDKKLDREEKRAIMENSNKMQSALLDIVRKLTEN